MVRLVRVLLWLGGLSLILSSVALAQGASPLPPMLVEAGKLYLVGADGTGMRLVYSGPQSIASSTWSPGGQWIAFSLQRSAFGGELYRVRANGRDAQRVLSQDIIQFNWDSGPLAWSPDGQRLAVVGGLDDNSGSDIFLVDARTGQSERLNVLINSEHLMWSPDGQWIAMFHTIYRKEGESRVLYRVSVDGHAREQITHFNTGDLVWSPDGQWISFLAYHWCGLALYRMRADGSNIQMITEVPRRWDLPLVHRSWAGANTSIRREMYLDMYDIVWSPDSQWIAFDTGYIGVNGLPEPDSLDIYRVRASGGPAERLTDNTVNDWRPQWSPDGQWLAFISNRNGQSAVYRMRPDGSAVQHVVDAPWEISRIAWFPRKGRTFHPAVPLALGLISLAGGIVLTKRDQRSYRGAPTELDL